MPYADFAELFGQDVTTRFEVRRQCGYDPQKLLPCDIRCEMCKKTFDAPFYYNDIREEWCSRPTVCKTCEPIRNAAIANMFDPEVLRRVMGMPYREFARHWYDDEVIDFDHVPNRNLAPFVSPLRYRKD